VAGCNNELCVEQGQEQLTACEMTPEYECLQFFKCERISPNECGFKPTPESERCMALLPKRFNPTSNSESDDKS
jgi:hypothetical protein